MAKKIKSRTGLVKAYDSCSEEVRDYFETLPRLLTDKYPLDVCLAYVFYRLESGQNMALYIGVMKAPYRAAKVAKSIINTHYMKREDFLKLYKIVFGLDLPSTAIKTLKEVEKVRDTMMRGKNANGGTKRNAICQVLEYAEEVNKLDPPHVRPFRDLTGASGGRKLKRISKIQTRFMLKGMGFDVR